MFFLPTTQEMRITARERLQKQAGRGFKNFSFLMTVDISHFFTYLVCSRDAFVIYPCSFNKRMTIIYSNRRHTATEKIPITEAVRRMRWEIVAFSADKKLRTGFRLHDVLLFSRVIILVPAAE